MYFSRYALSNAKDSRYIYSFMSKIILKPCGIYIQQISTLEFLCAMTKSGVANLCCTAVHYSALQCHLMKCSLLFHKLTQYIIVTLDNCLAVWNWKILLSPCSTSVHFIQSWGDETLIIFNGKCHQQANSQFSFCL